LSIKIFKTFTPKNLIKEDINMARDLEKKDLYESVKTLVECEKKHIHLTQHKLFTLFSLAFQYMLFQSTKKPGAYIIRIENSQLTDKLARKAKDPSTRKFIQSLLLPRKLKYQKSTFYLDFFHIGSWNMTSEIPKEKIKGAIIIKSTQTTPLQGEVPVTESDEEEEAEANELKKFNFPEDYYYLSLQENCPKTIVIAFEKEFEDVTKLTFPFIKDEEERNLKGVTISHEINWDGVKS
jgi:hypothetical protein